VNWAWTTTGDATRTSRRPSSVAGAAAAEILIWVRHSGHEFEICPKNVPFFCASRDNRSTCCHGLERKSPAAYGKKK